MSQPQDVAEQNIQMWRVKKLIKSLDAARGYRPPSPPSPYVRFSDASVYPELELL